jgi:hypothetical protein
MENKKFEFYSVTTFAHTFQVEARSPEEAFELAVAKCEAGAPGAFIDDFNPELSELGPDGACLRNWIFDDEGFREVEEETATDL